MKSKIIAMTALFVIAMCMLSPVLANSTDALEEDECYITVSGPDVDDLVVTTTVGNGTQVTWRLDIVNVSDKYINVTYTSESNEDVSIISIPDPDVLDPENGKGANRTHGFVTIAVDPYAKDLSEFTAYVYVHLTNVADKDDFSVTAITFDVTIDSTFHTTGMYNKIMGMFPNPLPYPLNDPVVTMVVSMILWLLIFMIALRIVIPIIAKVLDKTTPDIDDRKQFEKTLYRVTIPLVFLMAFNQGLAIVGASNEIIAGFNSLSYILCVILVSFIAWSLYVFIIASILLKIEKSEEASMIDMSLLPLFKMIGRIVILVAAVAAILASFGVDLSGILISAGVISLGITMGAQNVLSQFFSGLVILSTRPFRAGDYLKINDKVYIVRKVKIMFTEFTSWENDQIISMPNNVVTGSTIHNMTKKDLPVKQYVYFTVAYGTDLEKAKRVMIETAKKSKYVVLDDEHEAPGFRMTNFLSSGIELRLSYFARCFDDTAASAGEMRMNVYQAFIENGIEIPYDRVQIDILSDNSGKKKSTDLSDD